MVIIVLYNNITRAFPTKERSDKIYSFAPVFEKLQSETKFNNLLPKVCNDSII